MKMYQNKTSKEVLSVLIISTGEWINYSIPAKGSLPLATQG